LHLLEGRVGFSKLYFYIFTFLHSKLYFYIFTFLHFYWKRQVCCYW